MRIQALIAFATAFAFTAMATLPADAATSKKKRYQNQARASITVRKHRSYLDAGTTVKPGEKGYHDYYYMLTSRYPSYGPAGPDNRDYRYPLPQPFELPGFGF
jgi:hypothetical protein